jgi:hypothetical protein
MPDAWRGEGAGVLQIDLDQFSLKVQGALGFLLWWVLVVRGAGTLVVAAASRLF